jgi:hypothetical protein
MNYSIQNIFGKGNPIKGIPFSFLKRFIFLPVTQKVNA